MAKYFDVDKFLLEVEIMECDAEVNGKKVLHDENGEEAESSHPLCDNDEEHHGLPDFRHVNDQEDDEDDQENPGQRDWGTLPMGESVEIVEDLDPDMQRRQKAAIAQRQLMSKKKGFEMHEDEVTEDFIPPQKGSINLRNPAMKRNTPI